MPTATVALISTSFFLFGITDCHDFLVKHEQHSVTGLLWNFSRQLSYSSGKNENNCISAWFPPYLSCRWNPFAVEWQLKQYNIQTWCEPRRELCKSFCLFYREQSTLKTHNLRNTSFIDCTENIFDGSEAEILYRPYLSILNLPSQFCCNRLSFASKCIVLQTIQLRIHSICPST